MSLSRSLSASATSHSPWKVGDNVMIAWLCTEIFADFALALIMSLLLMSKKTGIEQFVRVPLLQTLQSSHSASHFFGFRRTNTILNKLVRYTISTGLITGLFTILCLVLFLRSRIAVALMIGPLYPAGSSLVHANTSVELMTVCLPIPLQSSPSRCTQSTFRTFVACP